MTDLRVEDVLNPLRQGEGLRNVWDGKTLLATISEERIGEFLERYRHLSESAGGSCSSAVLAMFVIDSEPRSFWLPTKAESDAAEAPDA